MTSTPTSRPSASKTDGGRLDGKRVLVTGAGSGIGRTAARLFRRRGAELVLVGRRAAALGETLAAGPRAAPPPPRPPPPAAAGRARPARGPARRAVPEPARDR